MLIVNFILLASNIIWESGYGPVFIPWMIENLAESLSSLFESGCTCPDLSSAAAAAIAWFSPPSGKLPANDFSGFSDSRYSGWVPTHQGIKVAGDCWWPIPPLGLKHIAAVCISCIAVQIADGQYSLSNPKKYRKHPNLFLEVYWIWTHQNSQVQI